MTKRKAVKTAANCACQCCDHGLKESTHELLQDLCRFLTDNKIFIPKRLYHQLKTAIGLEDK